MEPLIDRAQLLESLEAMGGEPAEALALILDLYSEDAPQLLGAIVQGAAAADFEQLRFAAHSLKSSSATLGAHRLAQLCQQMEHQAHRREAHNLSALAQQLQAAYQSTWAAFRDPALL